MKKNKTREMKNLMRGRGMTRTTERETQLTHQQQRHNKNSPWKE
jgi:hypothetical protein